MNAGICVWVVDDDNDCRCLFSRLLGLEMGVKCPQEFCSAAAMLAALKEQPAPEIILMDVQMPGMSGIEAIPFVHQIAPNTRVVMITSYFDDERQREALANGAVKLLRKSSPPDKVVEAIYSALRQPMSTAGRSAITGEVERRL